MKSAVIFIAIITGILCNSPTIWPPQWQADFTEQRIYWFGNLHQTSGRYYFDSVNDIVRIDKEHSGYDKFCSSIKWFSNEPCTYYYTQKKLILAFPESHKCCECCNEKQGCSAPTRDWMKNAQLVSQQSDQLEKWKVKYQDKTYYYVNSYKSNKIPFVIDKVYDKYIFDMNTYKEKTLDLKHLGLPGYCNTNYLQSCPWYSQCTWQKYFTKSTKHF